MTTITLPLSTTCAPWCAEHPTGPDRGPDACWADPVALRLYPAVGQDADDDGESGHVTLLMRRSVPRRFERPRTTSIFFDRFPDGEDGCAMDPGEAEITAFGLLALVAEARGDVVTGGAYRSAASDLAASLLARRTGETR